MQIHEVEIIMSDDVDLPLPVDSEHLRKHVSDTLLENGVSSGEFNIVFVGDGFMTELNEVYKGRKGTTDVLSFDLSNDFSEGLSGEVYVSLERAKAQAAEIGVPFEEEVVRLVTHGILHLAGHVHDTDAQYDVMSENTERLVREFFANRGAK